MTEKPRRKNRIPDGPRVVTRNISLPSDLADTLTAEAQKEGHHNVSRIVVAAITAYLSRKYDRRAA